MPFIYTIQFLQEKEVLKREWVDFMREHAVRSVLSPWKRTKANWRKKRMGNKNNNFEWVNEKLKFNITLIEKTTIKRKIIIPIQFNKKNTTFLSWLDQTTHTQSQNLIRSDCFDWAENYFIYRLKINKTKAKQIKSKIDFVIDFFPISLLFSLLRAFFLLFFSFPNFYCDFP